MSQFSPVKFQKYRLHKTRLWPVFLIFRNVQYSHFMSCELFYDLMLTQGEKIKSVFYSLLWFGQSVATEPIDVVGPRRGEQMKN